MTQETLREAVARAAVKELREQCIDMNGNCYAYVADGPCPYEGGWPVEVDGEFDLLELIDAAIETMFERLRKLPNEMADSIAKKHFVSFEVAKLIGRDIATAFQQENSDAD